MSKLVKCTSFIGNMGGLITTVKNTIDSGKELKNTANEIICNSAVNEDNVRLKGEMRIMLNVLKDEYELDLNTKDDSKDSKNKRLLIAATVAFPCYVAIGYVGYKGYEAIKNYKNKNEEALVKQDCLFTFKYLINNLGIKERMSDVTYIPTLEELELLKEQFELRTGESLIAFLSNIVNK